jgi:hypothetical protein
MLFPTTIDGVHAIRYHTMLRDFQQLPLDTLSFDCGKATAFGFGSIMEAKVND